MPPSSIFRVEKQEEWDKVSRQMSIDAAQVDGASYVDHREEGKSRSHLCSCPVGKPSLDSSSVKAARVGHTHITALHYEPNMNRHKFCENKERAIRSHVIDMRNRNT